MDICVGKNRHLSWVVFIRNERGGKWWCEKARIRCDVSIRIDRSVWTRSAVVDCTELDWSRSQGRPRHIHHSHRFSNEMKHSILLQQERGTTTTAAHIIHCMPCVDIDPALVPPPTPTPNSTLTPAHRSPFLPIALFTRLETLQSRLRFNNKTNTRT